MLSTNFFLGKRILLFTAAFLLLTIGLHTIVFDHHHPKPMGEKMQAVFHGDNKKWFIAAIVIVLIQYMKTFLEALLCCPVYRPMKSSRQFEESRQLDFHTTRTRAVLFHHLMRGLLNPKLF